MKKDPRRRKNGTCAHRGCKRHLPEITSRHRRYAGDALLLDPFCSTECCKEYHGVVITALEPVGRKPKVAA
jgi:hypothetical protein